MKHFIYDLVVSILILVCLLVCITIVSVVGDK